MGKGGQVTQGDALRSSGMPLEVMVARILPSLGMLPKGRYWYEDNATTYETDMLALGGWTSGPNSVEHAWFIECKQRQEDRYWCFFPQAENVRDLSRNSFIFDVLEDRDGLNPSLLSGLERQVFPDLPIVGDGTQLSESKPGFWSANAEAIQNALRQTVLPIGHTLRWVFQRNFILDYKGQQIELYLPVVVTTARIFVLRPDVEWKQLSTFRAIDECFSAEPAVISAFTTPSYVERYWSDRITFYLNEIRSRYPDVFSKRVFFQRLGKSQNEAVQHVASLLTRAMPTRVLITEFDAFGSVLSKYRSAVDKAVAAILPRK